MVDTKQELLSTTELSKILKVTNQAIYKWRAQGLPYIQLGEKTHRYKLDEVIQWREEYLNKKKRKAGAENGKTN